MTGAGGSPLQCPAMTNVVISSAARTAIGGYGKSLKDARAAVERVAVTEPAIQGDIVLGDDVGNAVLVALDRELVVAEQHARMVP